MPKRVHVKGFFKKQLESSLLLKTLPCAHYRAVTLQIRAKFSLSLSCSRLRTIRVRDVAALVQKSPVGPVTAAHDSPLCPAKL